MTELFKFIEEKEVDKEWRWTYSIEFDFIFNELEINYLTITDHPWKKKGRTMITKELILEMLSKMNGETLEPMEYDGVREPYEWETIHDSKSYRLFFWFKDGTTDHLWIRNCHRID